jgi:Tol biopolymer transport system component
MAATARSCGSGGLTVPDSGDAAIFDDGTTAGEPASAASADATSSDAALGAATTAPDRIRTDARWAWVAVLFGVWIVGGVFVVTRALEIGDVDDVGISPYHVIAYGGLLALGLTSLWLVLRSRRSGASWRAAFPIGLGSLGAGLLVLLAYVVLDVAWREGVGIDAGIENSVAPSRVLLVVGLALVAMAPLRASLLAGGEPSLRWPAVISAGLIAASVGGFGGYSPIVNPWLERPEDVAVDNGEVWLMDADGGRQTRLVEASPGFDFGNPVWSPDSTRIAFTRFSGPADDPGSGDQDIWVANADGSGARPFATGPGWQWFPRWSPDGAWIAYTEEAAGGPWLSSGPVGPDLGQGPQGPVFPGANAPSRPEAELWLRAADGGGEPVRITDAAGDDRSGSWSPDGERLVFDTTRDGNTELYIVAADGSNPVRLTDEAAEDWAASWSPDSQVIAFTSDRSGTAQIWTIAADGTGATQLTDDPTGALWPSWSPDGSRITYTGWETGRQQVWSMAADGSDRQNLSRSDATIDSVWDGSWGADGRILFTRVGQAPEWLLPIARDDLGIVAMLFSALLLALVIGLLARTGPPFGGVALALGIAALLVASQVDAWRFVPGIVLAGLAIDLFLRLVPPGRRAAAAAAGAAVAPVVAITATAAVTTGIGWSMTVILGVATAAVVGGWAIGSLIERHSFGLEPADSGTPASATGDASAAGT